MIELVNVHKGFGKKKVLNGIDLSIERGEVFVIIGQSGVGKTVILRHITGFLDPDQGQVYVEGERMDNRKPREKEHLRTKMGFLFQFAALINWLNVNENVGLPLSEHKVYPKEVIDEKVAEQLAVLQLSDAGEKMPDDLSGGMKKRVGLARAMIRNPEIILYDEPTSGLDPIMASRINELIRRMQSSYDITSVVVTHDMVSAYYIGDRIAMLYNGKIIQVGTPDEIRNSSNPVVQQFINGRLDGPVNV